MKMSILKAILFTVLILGASSRLILPKHLDQFMEKYGAE